MNPNYGSNCLHFKFKGKFTKDASIAACHAWGCEFDKMETSEKFVLLWDCLDMNDFEIAAKNQWQEHMKSYHDRIELVIVVSDNILIRGAARLILKKFGLNANVVRSFEALKIASTIA